MFGNLLFTTLLCSLSSVISAKDTGLSRVPIPAEWNTALARSKLQDPDYNPAATKLHWYSTKPGSKYVEYPNWSLYGASDTAMNQHSPETNVTFNTDESGNPDPGDVLQQGLGDCYLATALRALAARSPDAIKTALQPVNGTQLQLRVNIMITNATYTTMNISLNDAVQENVGLSLIVLKARSSGMDIIWPALIEKALAKVMSLCIAEKLACANGRLHSHRSYADLEGGDPSITMFMLTGRPFGYFLVADLEDTDILTLFKGANTQPIALGTSDTNTGFMYPGHAHWVVGTKGCSLRTSNPFERFIRTVSVGDIRDQVDIIYAPMDVDWTTMPADSWCLKDPNSLRSTIQTTTE